MGIDGLQSFKIRLAGLILGGEITVDEVIIHLKRVGRETLGKQLNGQALGQSGLAAGGRTGDEDDADGFIGGGGAGASGDLRGNVGDMLFVQRLRDQDNLMAAAGKDGIIEGTHAGDAQAIQPLPIAAKGRQQLGIVGHGLELGGQVTAGEINREAAIGGDQVEPLKVTCGWHHVAVMVVLVIAQAVEGEVVFLAVG
jgi:hypothetical protein